MSRKTGTFLRWTGKQRWIVPVFLLGVIGNVLVLAVEPFEWIDPAQPASIWVLLAGFAIAIPAYAGLCAFVRCPRCRMRIIWMAVSKAPHPIGLNTLWWAPQCPCCAYPREQVIAGQAESGITST